LSFGELCQTTCLSSRPAFSCQASYGSGPNEVDLEAFLTANT
jgi:hypothetical protein